MATKKSGIEVGLIMGSKSDWPTMALAAEALDHFDINYEKKIVSAHRTPDLLFKYAKTAEKRGLKIIIAGAGGAAHLPGMTAALTHLPVIGVPIMTANLKGLDSLLSIAQMPKGVPVATVAVGEPGAVNAGLMAVSILALNDKRLRTQLIAWRDDQRDQVLAQIDTDPKKPSRKGKS